MAESFILTSRPVDLRQHSAACELHEMNRTMCSADTMNPDRKVIFSCSCGRFIKGLKVRVPWWPQAGKGLDEVDAGRSPKPRRQGIR